MKKFMNGKAAALCLTVLVLLAAALWGGYYWQLPKFQPVTVELGLQSVPLSRFLREQANPEWAGFVTDMTALDYTRPGEHPVTLTHLGREETVTLTIRDTTAPQVTFQDVTLNLGQVATADMFVVSALDLSPVTYSFSKPLDALQQDMDVTVMVRDSSGNTASQVCRLDYVWLKESYTLEYGTLLRATDLLLDPGYGDFLIDPAQLDAINSAPVGEYSLTARGGCKESTCTITVQDTTPPALVVQEVAVYQGRTVAVEQFLVSAWDLSGPVVTRFATEPDTSELGTFSVTIQAQDSYGNTASAEATLRVVQDMNPPKFQGLTSITVEKHSTPDYTTGVSAYDSQDGYVAFTYDTSGVDLSKAGTYYVTYTARDTLGNTATGRRKITVKPDSADTDALVREHAAKCGTTIAEITHYVRSKIRYNHNWGGEDPVWYGFTNMAGNCYVHALCLQRLMSAHGYTTRLIWVEEQYAPHYWLIVDMGGYWRHIDATPSSLHSRYTLMTDTQRLETLSGRKWDTSLWPACE